MSLPKILTMVAALLLTILLMVAMSSVVSLCPCTSDDDRSTRRAMSTINDMISEARRSTEIDDSVEAAWEGGGTYLSPRHIALIGNYETMCCAVLIARRNGGAWKSKEAVHLRSIGLFSEEDVLKELDIIMQPNDCSEPITLDRESM